MTVERKSGKINLGIFYPADPLGEIPGGIEPFIRGIIANAPADLEIYLIGVTTDNHARPAGKWTECAYRGRKYMHLPLFYIGRPGVRHFIPATLRYLFSLLFTRFDMRFDILDFHRLEPVLRFAWSNRPKNAFLHQRREVLRDSSSDNRWKYLPGIYGRLEDYLMTRLSSCYAVSTEAVNTYQERYGKIRNIFKFVPTWMDDSVFYALSSKDREAAAREFKQQHNIDPDARILIFVGRLDIQKNPELLLQVFHRLVTEGKNVHLLVVGDGVLKSRIVEIIEKKQMQSKVTLLGLRKPPEIAGFLRVADLFLLTSEYEGMPIAVIEALGCGVPVVSTDVGEIRRLVFPGVNGEIADAMSADVFTQKVKTVLENLPQYQGIPCLEVAANYTPRKVLGDVYENYRRLAGRETQ